MYIVCIKLAYQEMREKSIKKIQLYIPEIKLSYIKYIHIFNINPTSKFRSIECFIKIKQHFKIRHLPNILNILIF